MSEIDYSLLPERKILCVDMKSFYASIEAVSRGLDPMKVCLAVIGNKKRDGSVVLAASPALKKKYNIRTGNRLYQIPDIPEIMVVEARMGLYLKRSMDITRLYNEFVPLDAIHVYSIDEAWLRLDGIERLKGDKWQVAQEIRKELLQRYGLPSSMGLGPNMFLAKVAMDIEGKKKGLVEWTYGDVSEKLWPVKLEECWGFGKRLSRRFARLGIRTVGELAQLPLEYLEKKFGIMGSQFYYHARGVDLSEIKGHYTEPPKGIGRGITLLKDYEDVDEIKTVIFELAEEVARRARKEHVVGKTIHLGIGYSKREKEKGFHVQRTIKGYTNLSLDIYRVALNLFKENYTGQVVRKASLSLSNLVPERALQLDLFSDKLSRIRLQKTKDYLQDKYGYQALFYGKSLKEGSILKKIRTTIGGHQTGDA